ncbi:MAG: acyl-CoA dehydrogenase family protein [Candidatus Geothermincolia bacterium]
MIGFSLTEEQSVYRQAAREFAENQMKPYAAELDRREKGYFDWGIVRRFADANLLGLPIPEEYGGPGVDYLTSALVSEELGAGCAGMTVVAGTTWLAVISIMLVGTPEQKQRYLPRICVPGGNLAALASTETEAGSDIAAMRTLAVKKGDRYVLNGRKHYITNAGLADFYVIFATTDPAKRHAGINAFIVDGDSPGLSVGNLEDKMGLRASRNAELVLDDVEVPAENLLGEEGTGFLVLLQTLDTSRPCLGAISVGLARAAFDAALSHARQRKQYGRPLMQNQGVSFMLSDMATAIDAARLLTWRAAWLTDQGMDSAKASSMCKVSASETAENVCSKAIDLLGAIGYSKDLPLEKYLRDAKAMSIYEGANLIQRIIISSAL